ncbi:hypothetical protein J6590_091033 [Homalodisca vitripennis]|nr:hypothetical protein J6590_091033 [Homalodisca vitripennis]
MGLIFLNLSVGFRDDEKWRYSRLPLVRLRLVRPPDGSAGHLSMTHVRICCVRRRRD